MVEEFVLALFEGIGLSSIIGTLVFLADSLYTSHQKDALTLMFLIKKPAENIFENIRDDKFNDDRVTPEFAREYYSEIINGIPSGKDKYKYQNYKWYNIYQKYQGEMKVLVAQRDYLLCRDMCIATITEIIGVLICSITRVIPWSFKSLVLLLVMYVITMIATYYKAERFCKNVIVVDLSNAENNNMGNNK